MGRYPVGASEGPVYHDLEARLVERPEHKGSYKYINSGYKNSNLCMGMQRT